LSTRTAAGQLFEIDLRLRPNGNAGLLVSNLNSFRIYQLESAWTWEHQALTRARFAAGDPAIGERFESLRREILALPRDLKTLCEAVGAMRHKMLDAHPNPSGLFDIKHDRGGMVDIEFLVQTLVLGHASQHPELLDNVGNIALLELAAKAGLIDAHDAEKCAQAYRDFRRMQHLLRLNDARFARVEADIISDQRDTVLRLWRAVLGD
jgi:glutamate-ammonia-ligase adenylyltransferase